MTPSYPIKKNRLVRSAARWLGLAAVACAGLVSLVGSGGGGGGGSPTPVLTVIGTSPTNGATGVGISSTISVTFSENLANTPALAVATTAGAVAGTVTRSGATVTFTPSAPLTYSTIYGAAIAGGIGTSGGTQSGTTSWAFTTAADPVTPPAIALSGTALTFNATPGGANPAAQTVSVTNSGGGTLSGLAVGTVAYGAGASGWLQAPTLNSTSAPATLTVQPVTGSLAAGTYTATVPITSGVASNSPRNVTVTFAVATAAAVTISGTADFESVPNDATGNGRLLYNSIANRPVRGTTVEVLPAAGGAALATGTTSSTGTYSLTISTPQSVIVRVSAQMRKTAGAGGTWDFTVRDNTQGDSLYVMDSPAFTPVAGSNTRNLRATSGWGGASYTTARVAGPFAILDVVYDATQKLLSASANATFPALQLMWSVNNRNAPGNEANGFIGTSFYRFDSTAANQHRIYILGFADSDTDEYDRPVVAHEFGHYFQSAFSRDDSIGGSHSGVDILDMRVAFSEGWGNAWSGMALNSQYYMDSIGNQQQGGVRIDLAAIPGAGFRGWYNEGTVQFLMYSWHANAGIGFTPIFNVLAGMRTTLPADATVSSIHSFAHYLKQAVPGQASAIDTLLAGQLITVANPQGSTEANGGGNADALPVYRLHTAAAGVAQNYCLNDDSAAGTRDAEGNKLGTNLFIRFTVGAAGNRTITVAGTTAAVVSDPDFRVYRNNGVNTTFQAGTTATETAVVQSVPAGTHLIELYDYALTRGNNASTNNGRRCFNVTVQ